MSQDPVASIIIRTKNEEALVGEVLTAVYEQTVRDIEVILVDSGSTDRTLQIARKFPLKIIETRPEEFTYGRGLNIGCEAARGEFLVFVSAHAVPMTANWLSCLLCHFEDANVAGVWGKHIESKTIPPKECVVQGEIVRQDLTMFLSNCYFGFSNVNAAIRAGVWRLHAFDELLPYTEDKKWALQVLNDGYTVVYDSRAIVWHYHHDTLRQIWYRAHLEHVGFANFLNLPLPSTWEVLWRTARQALRRLWYAATKRQRIDSLTFDLASAFAREIGRYTGLRKGKAPVRSRAAKNLNPRTTVRQN
jgi:rhamnosyltransferase